MLHRLLFLRQATDSVTTNEKDAYIFANPGGSRLCGWVAFDEAADPEAEPIKFASSAQLLLFIVPILTWALLGEDVWRQVMIVEARYEGNMEGNLSPFYFTGDRQIDSAMEDRAGAGPFRRVGLGLVMPLPGSVLINGIGKEDFVIL